MISFSLQIWIGHNSFISLLILLLSLTSKILFEELLFLSSLSLLIELLSRISIWEVLSFKDLSFKVVSLLLLLRLSLFFLF
jgi:hypothetical protein